LRRGERLGADLRYSKQHVAPSRNKSDEDPTKAPPVSDARAVSLDEEPSGARQSEAWTQPTQRGGTPSSPGSSADPALPGMQLSSESLIEDKYRIVELLGVGGMGHVYEAENIRIGRRVAIKVLSPEHVQEERLLQRFEREAQAAARLSSDHIAEVYDFGRLPSGVPFMVMEVLDGVSLKQRVRSQKQLEPNVVVPLAIQLLRGLSRAHEAGIVHRDLKPSNIFIARKPDGGEIVKIIDFGISKLRHAPTDADALTLSGDVVGTPQYMAPEQARGLDVDHRADLFAVGVIMYYALSGALPYEGKSILEVLAKDECTPIDRHLPAIDPALAAIVHKAMAVEPTERFADAAAFIAVLERWHGRRDEVSTVPPKRRPRPRWPWLVALGALALGAIAAWMIWPRPEPLPQTEEEPTVTEKKAHEPEPPPADEPAAPPKTAASTVAAPSSKPAKPRAAKPGPSGSAKEATPEPSASGRVYRRAL
jgi:eukaryotic-like serine/threonine-protein kinase